MGTSRVLFVLPGKLSQELASMRQTPDWDQYSGRDWHEARAHTPDKRVKQRRFGWMPGEALLQLRQADSHMNGDGDVAVLHTPRSPMKQPKRIGDPSSNA